MSTIKAAPTEGLCYRPHEPAYYDPALLSMELERVYDICHGCRLCFKLCPSFPALFDAVDRYDGDVRKLSAAESDRVVDLCYQCKLCYNKCPYTPNEGHSFQLDFPALLLRAKAVRVKRHGLKLRERLLGNPDLLGRLAGVLPWLTNLANRIGPNRWLLEKLLGVHRKKLLPDFYGQSFQAWFALGKHGLKLDGEQDKVFLFPSCFVNFNAPEVGKAAVEVFARNDLTVKCDYRRCCGMPALDGGDVPRAQQLARANVAQLLPYVRQGYRVLAINPTCSMMMRKEYPLLLGDQDAQTVVEAVMDPSEYLNTLRKEGRLNTAFKSSPGRVHYHVPCHLRAQNMGYPSRDMMRNIDGTTEVKLVTECCSHDGTWAMKKEFFSLSLQWGQKAFTGMAGEGTGPTPPLLTTDCPLASIQFFQALGQKPMHPLEVLARAYREDGFPHPVQDK